MQDRVKPSNLPEHLVPIWEEMEGQFAPRIGALGLESVCAQVCRMRRARQQIDAEGEIVADARGNPSPHPALAVEKQASGEVREWIKRYGVR